MRCMTSVVGAFLLFSAGILSAEVVPLYTIRSQSTNAAFELAGWEHQVNLFKTEKKLYGSFSITPAFFSSYKPERIAQSLFCDALAPDCCDSTCPSINIQGSLVPHRTSNALLAEYFGLSTDFSSIVSFQPRIRNFMVDFNFYLGLERIAKGLFFRVHAPVVRSWWELNFCEHDINAGTAPYFLGYFNPTLNGENPNEYGVAHSALLQSFQSYVVDGKTPTISGVTWEPLNFAKMYRCRLEETQLSDLQMALGWNFLDKEDYHFGVEVRAAAPTATRPSACYLFEPLVGNGRCWEVGGGLTTHWTMWHSAEEASEFGVYFDANIMHLFKAKQCRTFDLCGKPLSRYMLAAKFASPAVALNNVDLHAPSAQFQGFYTTLANITTFPVNVEIGVQGDLALMFAYTHNNYTFDFGYGFYGRSKEKICRRCEDCCCTGAQTFAENTWALKGDAVMYGFRQDQESGLLVGPGIALSASESGATVFGGTNNPPDGLNDLDWWQNPGVDYPEFVQSGALPLFTKQVGVDGGGEPLQSSFNPIFIKESDIDYTGTRIISNKLFAHFSYAWNDHEDWVPYLGLGGQVEFGHRDSRCCQASCNAGCGCTTSCNACQNSCSTCETCCPRNCKGRDVGLWQWGVWLKGGISFN